MTAIPSDRYFVPLGGALSYLRIENGVCIRTNEAEVFLTWVTLDAVKIEVRHPWSVEVESYSVIQPKGEPAEIAIFESDAAIDVRSQAGDIRVTKSPFQLRISRPDGSIALNTEGLDFYRHLNDAFTVQRTAVEGDLILGLGEKTGSFNRKGREFTLWNTDVLNPNSAGEFTQGRDSSDPRSNPTSTEFDPYYISIPFFQTVDSQGRAAGFFIDNAYRSSFSFTEDDRTIIHFTGGRYIEYVFLGPSLAQVLKAYTGLTGRVGAPPMWSLGHHYCRWHPYTQFDIDAITKQFHSKSLPCDSIWLDIDYMDGYRVFTWNGETYPDVPDLVSELRRDGRRLVTIVDPGVKVEPGWELFDSGVEANIFCKTEGGAIYQGQVWPGRTAFPDFALDRARKWWGDRNAKHVALGIAGIWNDMNEPATGDIPCQAMRFGGGTLPHEAFHNTYATYMAKSTHEGLLASQPNKRPFILSRAGSPGIQKYAANWLGDNMSRWDHLALSIPMSLGLGVSGQPFIGSDIGGFCEAATGELLARWYQAAALTPFFRNHNATGNPDQYPWSFGVEIEEICRESIQLRYRLLPYLYSVFVEASLTGAPVMRPMVWHYAADTQVRELNDQFLLGDSLLVAPVLEEGATTRKLIIPNGEWREWLGGIAFCEGQHEVSVTLKDLPIFVRGGSVIPMWPIAPGSTMGYHPEVIELLIAIPSEDGETDSFLVEDDGETFDFANGGRITSRFKVTRSGSSLRVVAQSEGAEFTGFMRKAFHLRFLDERSQPDVRVETVLQGFDITIQLEGK